MKSSLEKKIFGRVSIVHGLILLFLIMPAFFRGCAHKPKNDVQFFDLAGGPAPAPSAEPESEAAPDPAPEIKSKPEPKQDPKPEPKPEKKLTPKPIVTNTPPKKVESNAPPKKTESKKPAVTNAPPKKAETNAPAKPKTEDEKMAERLANVRQDGKRVVNPNSKSGTSAHRAVDYSGLRNALNSAASGTGSGTGSGGSSSGSGSGSGGMYSPFADYYDRIKQRMYAVWQQPAGAPKGLPATATVRVERDGTVSMKSITRRSGNAQFDQSVQNALDATIQLPVPPADLPSRTIEIEFVLSD